MLKATLGNRVFFVAACPLEFTGTLSNSGTLNLTANLSIDGTGTLGS